MWTFLGIVMVLLFLLAALLLVKADVLSSSRLSDEQSKSLWAFLGVALGAVVTLIGALLTEQHNRRTAALTREANDREQMAREKQQALARETEERLLIDTVAKVLELITVEGAYAPKARVAGAVATMMQLRGGTVAIRILGELWTVNAIDSDTAVWLIDRVLRDRIDGGSGEQEAEDAINLLLVNAAKLVPAGDDMVYFWPDALVDTWPGALSERAKYSLVVLSANVLLACDVGYWNRTSNSFPLTMLVRAIDDPEVGVYAALVLAKLIDLDALTLIGFPVDDATDVRIRSLSEAFFITGWFHHLLSQFEPWVKGQRTYQRVQISPIALEAPAPDR